MSALWRILRSWTADDDPLRQALRISGVLRFGIVLIQGVLLVRLGVPIELIALVEALFYIFNLCRARLLSAGKYAGYQVVHEAGYGSVFIGFTWLGTLSAVLTMIAMYLLRDDFGLWDDDVTQYALIAALVWCAVPSESYDVYYATRNRPRHIIAYTIVANVAQVAIIVGMLIAGADMWTVVVALLVLFAVRSLHLMVAGRVWQLWRIPKDFLAVVLPIAVHGLIGGLLTYVDGWMVQAWEGDEAFVYYRFGAREQPLISILVGAAVSAALLKSELVAAEIRREIVRLLHLIGPLTVVLTLIAPWVFALVYEPAYAVAGVYFSIYGLLLISRVVFVQAFFYHQDRRWQLAAITLFEVIANIAVSIALYRTIGLWGIPIGTVVTDWIFRVVMVYAVKSWTGISMRALVPIKWLCYYGLAILICAVTSFYLYHLYAPL